MKWRRRIIFGLLGAIVIGGLAYGFWPKARLVDVARVARGPLEATVDEEGRTRVEDRYVVSAPVSGFAQRIELEVGDPVKRGQKLLSLEPLRASAPDPRAEAEAKARVEAARAAVQSAEEQVKAAAAEADLAQKDRDRLVKLSASQFISQDRLDAAWARVRTAEATLRSTKFSVEVARYQLEAARTALAFTGTQGGADQANMVDIQAPVSGRVLKVQHESEGVVGRGQDLIEIGDPHTLEVAVDVLSADAVRIQPGMPVRFERWGGDEPLQGRVRNIEPVGFTKISALGVEEQRVWVISDIISPPAQWARLGDGYRVEASFILWRADDVMQVPASALFRYRGEWTVFVVDNGKAHRRAVKLGHRSVLAAQVIEGLAAGESVIVHPDETIDEGVAVAAR